jgi:hypothetical protein
MYNLVINKYPNPTDCIIPGCTYTVAECEMKAIVGIDAFDNLCNMATITLLKDQGERLVICRCKRTWSIDLSINAIACPD